VAYFNYLPKPLKQYLRSVAKTVASKTGFDLLYDKFHNLKGVMIVIVSGVSTSDKEIQL
jgi:hypothetical protein